MNVIDLDGASRLVIISGVPGGNSGGSGQFIAHLQDRITALTGNRIKLICRPERPVFWLIVHWLRQKAYRKVVTKVIRYFFLLSQFWLSIWYVYFKRNQVFVLLHPQHLGYKLTLRLIKSRKKPPLIYLLDSSFFCIASYNHLKGENGPCLRCLEQSFNQIRINGCQPFPTLNDWSAVEFVSCLQELGKKGRVRIAAQNQHQAALAQRHFAFADLPPVIGLWTQDWDGVFFRKNCTQLQCSADSQCSYAWDVLFHGHCLSAKGADWLARVAEKCPELNFMFPFARPEWFKATQNCTFLPLTWEDGLRDEIVKSKFVFVPSLWSAPIEGSLVKSIACANAVAVVNNSTSFSDELPSGLVFKLSEDPATAAVELRRASERDWRPDCNVKTKWLAEFCEKRNSFVPDLIVSALGVK